MNELAASGSVYKVWLDEEEILDKIWINDGGPDAGVRLLANMKTGHL
jgi:hypothetical protein